MTLASHLNQEQLALRWNLSESTIANWRSKGIGPAFLKLHNRVVYREEDIVAYEAQSLRKSTGEKFQDQEVRA
ncbi:helix-turn-helix domain-containing protein [Agarilytica rhodophyticola]|uniref:helix-turn-helix domain-containing protein n=1 Tax=Agarilytica rhodophyticola TaxID=1737490 RepID=UPI000B348382|nr:helix-turn-helix domain-containing protein [Agarilytica rhodophyticola]